jgi:hypothetical protein
VLPCTTQIRQNVSKQKHANKNQAKLTASAHATRTRGFCSERKPVQNHSARKKKQGTTGKADQYLECCLERLFHYRNEITVHISNQRFQMNRTKREQKDPLYTFLAREKRSGQELTVLHERGELLDGLLGDGRHCRRQRGPTGGGKIGLLCSPFRVPFLPFLLPLF